jgi:hypothetical protein
VEFNASIAPKQTDDRTSPDIPGASVQATITSLGGRNPAKLSFSAPSVVDKPQNVTFNLTFGTGSNAVVIPVTVPVIP